VTAKLALCALVAMAVSSSRVLELGCSPSNASESRLSICDKRVAKRILVLKPLFTRLANRRD
jgi:hypothetical protein